MATVSIHVRHLAQLFNSLDPSPFWDRDLDREAAEFIEEEFSEKRAERAWHLHVHTNEGDSLSSEHDRARHLGRSISRELAARARRGSHRPRLARAVAARRITHLRLGAAVSKAQALRAACGHSGFSEEGARPSSGRTSRGGAPGGRMRQSWQKRLPMQRVWSGRPPIRAHSSSSGLFDDAAMRMTAAVDRGITV